MPIKLNEDRKYQRFRHTNREKEFLRSRGFVAVSSSNVSAIAKDDQKLLIRFHHGGATYAYPKSGKLYEAMLRSSSKGKFVWRELIRKKVPYYKTTQKPLKDGKPLKGLDPMQKAKLDMSKLGATLLAGLAVTSIINTSIINTTIINNKSALATGTFASLELARFVNGNTQMGI